MPDNELTFKDRDDSNIYTNFLITLENKQVSDEDYDLANSFLISKLSQLVSSEQFKNACAEALEVLTKTQFLDIVGLDKYEGIEIENDDN